MNKEDIIETLKNMKIHVYRADGMLEDLDVDKDSEDFDLIAVNNAIDAIIEKIYTNYSDDSND